MSISDNRKNFYWKKDRDFYKRHDIKLMMKQRGFGHDAVIIYEQLMCEACVHGGKLRYSEEAPYTKEDLELIIEGNFGKNFDKALNYMIERGLVEIWEDGTFYFDYVAKMTGSETGRTRRNRKNEVKKKPEEVEKLQEGVENLHQDEEKITPKGVENLHQDEEKITPSERNFDKEACKNSTRTRTTAIDTVRATVIDTDRVTTNNNNNSENLFCRLSMSELEELREKFKNHMTLIKRANESAKDKKVNSAYKYILGYAKNTGWIENE